MKDNLKGLKNDKIKKNIILIYGIVSLLIVMFFYDYVLTSSYKKNSNTIYMNDNWDIRINDKEHINVSLDNFSFKTVTIGDTIELSSRFPDDWDYENAIMCFHTRQATVEMYVDGKLEYQYGQDRLENGKTVGSGLLYIDIKDEYKGKDLKLALEVSEKKQMLRENG